MVRDVAFGQYFPAKSLIHKLDPRAKIIMLIAFLALVFCTFNYAALAVVAVCTAAIVLMSGVPVKFYFKSLKIIIFIVIVTSILNLFYGTVNSVDRNFNYLSYSRKLCTHLYNISYRAYRRNRKIDEAFK